MHSFHRMTEYAICLTVAVGMLFVFPVSSVRGAQSHSGNTERYTAGAARETMPSRPGSRAYIDPRTGRLISPPPADTGTAQTLAEGETALAPRDEFNRSSEGLVVESGPTPAHGYSVHLRGRFRSGSMALKNPDGTITIRPYAQSPEAGK